MKKPKEDSKSLIPKEEIIITEEEANSRLDAILAKRYEGRKSRTYFQSLIDSGDVLLNGEPTKKRMLAKEGDCVEITWVFPPEIDLTPEDIPLEILFEDEDIIVVNKPVGLVVHPAPGNWSHTFVNALLYHCQELKQWGKGEMRPGIVHRLDKETSGVLVAAKTILAHQRLVELFSKREVEKEYLAVCLGNPGDVTLDSPIGRHPVHRKRMAVLEKGKKATTVCSSLATDGELSLVKIRLLTGRTHQIRVHLHHRNTPVLGDSVYGNAAKNEKYGAKRQLLHARRLKFIHPMTGKEMDIVAPLPDDMEPFVKRLSKGEICGL